MAILRNFLDAGVWVLAAAIYLLAGFGLSYWAISVGARHVRYFRVRRDMRQMEREVNAAGRRWHAIVTEKR